MRRTICARFATLMTLAFCGCGGTKTPTVSPAPPPAQRIDDIGPPRPIHQQDEVMVKNGLQTITTVEPANRGAERICRLPRDDCSPQGGKQRPATTEPYMAFGWQPTTEPANATTVARYRVPDASFVTLLPPFFKESNP